jgi:hypothetical protein
MAPAVGKVEDWILQALKDAGRPVQYAVLEKAVHKLSGLSVKMPKASLDKCIAALMKRGAVVAPLAGSSSRHGGSGKTQVHVYYELPKEQP